MDAAALGRPPRAGAAPAPPDPGARALAAGVVTLALAALLATFAPGMWAWGLAGARFVPMPWRWGWLVPLVALLPPLARPLVAGFAAFGRALDGRWGALVAFACGVALVIALPDRTWFTGDFLQRLSGIQTDAPSANYVGAMPFDWLMHAALPRLFLADPSAEALGWLRLLGVIECGLLVVAARAWTRSLGLRGAETAAGVVLVCTTGALGVFTGLGKPAALMCVVTLAILTHGVAVARGAGGRLGFGLLIAFALLLHRSAVLLLPAWLIATALAIAHERRAERARWARLLPLALPLVVVIVAWPRLVSAVLVYDLPHHLKPGGSVTGQTAEGGWFGAAHLADLASVLALLAPAFALMLPVTVRTGAPAWRDPGERFRSSMVAASALVLALVFPQQGIFRDLDVFAPWTVPLQAVGLGALVARVGAGARRAAWLARAALVTAGLGLALVAAYASPEAGLARVRAYLEGPPLRDPTTRSLGWDFLIGPYIRLGRLDDAVACLDRAIALAPHRRLFLTLAVVEAGRGRPDRAAAAYQELVRRWPADALGWVGLAGARYVTGERAASDSALARVAALTRGDPAARAEIARYRAQFTDVWPGPPAALDTLLAPR